MDVAAHEYGLLIFRLDTLRIAVAIRSVEQVLLAAAITPLPGSPDAVAGVIDLHGMVVPIFDPRRRFCLPARPLSIYDKIIIAKTPSRRVGLIVDGVDGLLFPEPGSIEPAENVLPGIPRITGIIVMKESLVFIHDLTEFLMPDENRSLARALESAGVLP